MSGCGRCHNRTVTSRQGIRKWYLSNAPRSHSNPLVPFVAFAVIAELDVPVILCLKPSIAALAKEPPVPLIAETAMLAVSKRASVRVAFPLTNDAVVPDTDAMKSPSHRGSNQSAEKSKSEKTRTKSRIWTHRELQHHCWRNVQTYRAVYASPGETIVRQ